MQNRLIVDKILQFFPYQPTREQQSALTVLADFICSQDNNLLLLKGFAGTGKTSLLGALVKALNFLRTKTILLAPTGRAAKVFAAYAEQTAYTIHKKIYRQKKNPTILQVLYWLIMCIRIHFLSSMSRP